MLKVLIVTLTISKNKNELLGMILDSKLSFEDHINNLYKKASQKLDISKSCSRYVSQKRKTIMKAFITSQSRYCSLVWMFHSRILKDKINSLRKRALRKT